MSDNLVAKREGLAEYTGMTWSILARAIKLWGFPKPTKVGLMHVWDKSEIELWMKNNCARPHVKIAREKKDGN